MARALTRCDQCGQIDDHPMVHILGGRSVHHDCLSASERDLVIGSDPVAAQIVEAAESGIHGDDLVAHIEQLHAQPKED